MDVIFNNLPENLSAYEVRRLVSDAILPKGIIGVAIGILSVGSGIKRLEFKVITEIKLEQECRYGIATIEPDKAALRVISRLQKRVFRGYHISVREYNRRSYSNDRRNVRWRKVQWDYTERREQERRVSAQSVSVG